MDKTTIQKVEVIAESYMHTAQFAGMDEQYSHVLDGMEDGIRLALTQIYGDEASELFDKLITFE